MTLMIPLTFEFRVDEADMEGNQYDPMYDGLARAFIREFARIVGSSHSKLIEMGFYKGAIRVDDMVVQYSLEHDTYDYAVSLMRGEAKPRSFTARIFMGYPANKFILAERANYDDLISAAAK